MKRHSISGAPCKPCEKLSIDQWALSTIDRVTHGAKEHTPSLYLGYHQLVQRIRRLQHQVNSLKLNELNVTRQVTRLGVKLDEYKRFAAAIATNNIPGVGRLVSTCLKQRKSIRAIVDQMHRAIDHLYSPKNFVKKELHLAFLFWKLGNAKVCSIAAKALNLPSVSTARRALNIPKLKIPHQSPTIELIKTNLRAIFPASEVRPSKLCFNLMIDEIKVEERPRYQYDDNSIVGMCREHIHSHEILVHSASDIDALADAEKAGEVHRGTVVCFRSS